jgi:hypothetical protein
MVTAKQYKRVVCALQCGEVEEEEESGGERERESEEKARKREDWTGEEER